MTELEKETSGGVNSKLYEARGNFTIKKGHHILLWKDVWRREKRSQHSTNTSDSSKKLHPKSEGDIDAWSSSNSRNKCAPRTEPSGTVAVSAPEIETIALPSSVHEEERNPLQT